MSAALSALVRAAELEARGAHPLAVLDIDLTLVENGPRTRSLLVDYLRQALVDRPDDEVDALCQRARAMPLAFSIRDNLAALGLGPALTKERLGEALRFWREAFFDPARLALDEAMPGAPEAVQRLHAAGVTIVYLTARPASLAAGTVQSLAALGFPIACPGAVLVTKETTAAKADERRMAESDADYKTRALRWIARLGEAVLCADNEPEHANAMHAAFPDALTVLVATRHSEPAPPLAPGIVRVPGLAVAL